MDVQWLPERTSTAATPLGWVGRILLVVAVLLSLGLLVLQFARVRSLEAKVAELRQTDTDHRAKDDVAPSTEKPPSSDGTQSQSVRVRYSAALLAPSAAAAKPSAAEDDDLFSETPVAFANNKESINLQEVFDNAPSGQWVVVSLDAGFYQVGELVLSSRVAGVLVRGPSNEAAAPTSTVVRGSWVLQSGASLVLENVGLHGEDDQEGVLLRTRGQPRTFRTLGCDLRGNLRLENVYELVRLERTRIVAPRTQGRPAAAGLRAVRCRRLELFDVTAHDVLPAPRTAKDAPMIDLVGGPASASAPPAGEGLPPASEIRIDTGKGGTYESSTTSGTPSGTNANVSILMDRCYVSGAAQFRGRLDAVIHGGMFDATSAAAFPAVRALEGATVTLFFCVVDALRDVALTADETSRLRYANVVVPRSNYSVRLVDGETKADGRVTNVDPLPTFSGTTFFGHHSAGLGVNPRTEDPILTIQGRRDASPRVVLYVPSHPDAEEEDTIG